MATMAASEGMAVAVLHADGLHHSDRRRAGSLPSWKGTLQQRMGERRTCAATRSLAFQHLPTRMATQRRLCSSITVRNLSLRPSAVASNWKSMAQTWWGYSA